MQLMVQTFKGGNIYIILYLKRSLVEYLDIYTYFKHVTFSYKQAL